MLIFVNATAIEVFSGLEKTYAQCTPSSKQVITLVQNPGMVDLNLVTDFQADPSGTSNSYCAFRQAAMWMAARGGHCNLYIPAGNYLINSQIFGGGTNPDDHALTFYGGKTNINIIGDPGGQTKIQYTNGLLYGVFSGTERTPFSFIYIQQSSNISISNIHADGGTETATIGNSTDVLNTGHNFGLNPSLTGSAVDISHGCQNISVSNCSFTHFCADGIHINGNPNQVVSSNIVLRQVQCTQNGRMGLAVTAVNTLTASQCKFNFNATGNAKITPSCGIDFEPNMAFTALSPIQNVQFADCEAVGNLSSALQILPVKVGPPENGQYSANITFTRCKFGDYDNHKIDNHNNNVEACARNLKFIDCDFEGLVEAGFAASSEAEALVFTRCRFSDEKFAGTHRANNYLYMTKYGAGRNRFISCKFVAKHKGTRLINYETTEGGVVNMYNDVPEFGLFRSCTMLCDYGNLNPDNPNPGQNDEEYQITANLKGCIFDGDNEFRNATLNFAAPKIIRSVGLVFQGSTDPCNTNTLTIDNMTWSQRYQLTSLFTDPSNNPKQYYSTIWEVGPENVPNLTTKARWVFDNWAKLSKSANENITLSLHQGDQLLLKHKFSSLLQNLSISNEGLLAMARPPGGSVIFSGINYDGSNNNVLFVDPIVGASGNPLWNWTYGVNFQGLGNCLYGKTIANNCSPNYLRLQDRESMAILYSYDYLPSPPVCSLKCWGAGPFQYKLNNQGPWLNAGNGNTITFTTTGGNDVLEVEDGEGCAEVFTLNSTFEWAWVKSQKGNCPEQGITGQIEVLAYGQPGIIEYSINGGSTITMAGNAIIQSAVWNLAPGTYTITATNNTATTISTVLIVEGPSAAMCCNAELVAAGSTELLHNGSQSSQLIAQYGTLIDNRDFYIDGEFVVDQDVNFSHCRFYFTAESYITIAANVTLSMDYCVLKASCNGLWEGIFADDASEQLILLNCELRDMNEGVVLSRGAKGTLLNNHLLDNMTGMQILNAPPGYVSGIGGNQGLVEGNTFTSSGNGPLYTQFNVSQGQYGLKLIGCAEVRIGCPPANGPANLFSHLATGIFIQPTPQYPNACHELRYNQFADIRENPNAAPDIPVILQNTYGTPSGAGVYIRRMQDPIVPVNWWSSTTPMVHILGQSGVSAFARCDKAVVGMGTGVGLLHYQISDCVGGFLMNDAHYQNYLVQYNQMQNVMLGVQLAGNLHTAQVQHNQLRLMQLDAPNYQLNGIPDPKGIDVQYWTNLHGGQTNIFHNTIEIPGIRGIGIAVNKTGKFTTISDNTVNFTTSNSTNYNPYLLSSPQLHGIVSQQGDGNYVSCNFVNGHSNSMVFGARNSSALTLNRSINHEVHCNQVNNSRFGAQIRGYCHTDSLLFRANTFTNHVYGLLTVPAVFSDEGDMGQIGDVNQDNNNVFAGTYANQQGEATYRFWGNAQNVSQRKIYTAQPFSNGSNFPQDPYAPFYIQLTSSNTQNCFGISGCGSTWEPVAPPDLDPTWAMEVASDSMNYYLFPEVSQWVAQYQLYSDLERDSALLAANTLLNTFYQTRQNQAMGMLRGVEKMVGILSDSTSRNDSLLFMTRLNDAFNQNNLVSDPEDHIQHEKWINAMLLKVFQWGRDSLSLQEQQEIGALAHSCPAVNGLAVYYARVLNSFYEPLANYEDYALCNGSAKGAEGPFAGLSAFLENPGGQAEASEKLGGLGDEIAVYPVPAANQVYFKSAEAFTDQATLQILDLSGRVLLTAYWPKGQNFITVNLASLSSGLYTWRCTGNGSVYAGKLIISK